MRAHYAICTNFQSEVSLSASPWRTESLGNQCSCQWTDDDVESAAALRDWITRFVDDRSINRSAPSVPTQPWPARQPLHRSRRVSGIRATIAHRITSNLDRRTLLIHARNAYVSGVETLLLHSRGVASASCKRSDVLNCVVFTSCNVCQPLK